MFTTHWDVFTIYELIVNPNGSLSTNDVILANNLAGPTSDMLPPTCDTITTYELVASSHLSGCHSTGDVILADDPA